MAPAYDLPAAEKVTVATIGVPGQRVFLLQARQGRQLLTVKLEKQQVDALATHLGGLLEHAPRPGHIDDVPPLEEPHDPDFAVGTINLTYDEDDDRVQLVFEELIPEGDPPGSIARLGLSREQAGAIAIEGRRLVESGRPPCPLCHLPLDPGGHSCPKTNGHRTPRR